MPEIQPIQSSPELHYIAGYSRAIPISPNSPYLRVSFGQATFDAEGTEAPGRFFSRRASWPGTAASGVTIGRGYDLGSRTQLQVARELSLAGVSRQDAVFLAAGAGLRGEAAGLFVRNRAERLPVLSLEAQQRLFENITTPETIADLKRIFSKPDVVSTYGAVQWESLPTKVQELVFDLRYRGDYTPAVRRTLQPLLVQKEWEKICELMQDKEFWTTRGVPPARIEARGRLAESYPSARSDVGGPQGCPPLH